MLELAELVKLVEDSNGSEVLSKALQCDSRSSVVDKALGMLGYNAAPTYQKTITLLSETIASLLDSSIVSGEYSSCKCRDILETGDSSSSSSSSSSCPCKQHVAFEEKVVFGSCLSSTCLRRVLEGCGKIIGYGYGTMIFPLIEVVLKVAVGTCLFRRRTPAACSLYVLEKDEACSVELRQFLEKLAQHKETLYDKLSPLSRLHAWRLHPMLLKQDLSSVVIEALQRPLLLLGDELKHRPDWKTFVTCLAASPLIFSEVRRLLHIWMASTGLSRLWHILVEVTVAVKNTVAEPSSSPDQIQPALLSFYLFYRTGSRNLVKLLAGPCIEITFLEIVSTIHKMESSEDHSFVVPWPCEDSIWTLLVSFPEWFYLALRTVFMAEDLVSKGACAKYVALVLFPTERVLTGALPEKILEVAGNWQRVNKKPIITEPDCSPVQPPSLKRLKTERKSAEVRGGTTLCEAKAWMEDVYQLFQQHNRSSKLANILQQLFCLAPVFADSKLWDAEVGELFLESVVHERPTIPQSAPTSIVNGVRKGVKEPAHRTERLRGGGRQWIPGMLQFLRRSSSRMRQKSDDAEAANRCILELAGEWFKSPRETAAEDIRRWFPGKDSYE